MYVVNGANVNNYDEVMGKPYRQMGSFMVGENYDDSSLLVQLWCRV
jgi:hypothetical protein